MHDNVLIGGLLIGAAVGFLTASFVAFVWYERNIQRHRMPKNRNERTELTELVEAFGQHVIDTLPTNAKFDHRFFDCGVNIVIIVDGHNLLVTISEEEL